MNSLHHDLRVEHGVQPHSTATTSEELCFQPEVTEGGVVLYQNNTYPIMAGDCHIVMTAACSLVHTHYSLGNTNI